MSDDDLTQFSYRLLRDAMNEATAAYWLRRAEQFEAARPRPGDNRRRGSLPPVSLDEIRAVDERCRLAAEACRQQAALTRGVAA